MNIFVGNLSFQTTPEELYATFSKYGAVERVNIIANRDTGQARGFAFVEMASEDADRAIAQLDGVELKGSSLTVNASGDSLSHLGREDKPILRDQRTKVLDFGLCQVDNETSSVPTVPLQSHVTTNETYIVDLDGIVTVTARAIEVFGTREKALRWLRTPLPSLSDRTPLSMMNTTVGIDSIADVLGRIEQGVW